MLLKLLTRLYLALSLFVLVGAGLAGSTTPVEAYPGACGQDTAAGRLVPDKPLKYNFGPACAEHDACYRSPYAFKEACDEEFRRDLVRVCNTAEPEFESWTGWNLRNRARRRACLGLAYTYYGTVAEFGEKYKVNPQSQATYPYPQTHRSAPVYYYIYE